MLQIMTVGRNEPCPCGSGRKYKSCCIGNERKTSRGLVYLLVTIGTIAAAGVAATVVTSSREKALAPTAGASRATTPRPQPPGPVPAGKVWSVEHGHWHDAAPPGAQPTRENPITMTPRNMPQPPGPVPPGKEWSPEHGHWHDKK